MRERRERMKVASSSLLECRQAMMDAYNGLSDREKTMPFPSDKMTVNQVIVVALAMATEMMAVADHSNSAICVKTEGTEKAE